MEIVTIIGDKVILHWVYWWRRILFWLFTRYTNDGQFIWNSILIKKFFEQDLPVNKY